MITDKERMQFAARIISVVRSKIERNGGLYSGAMVPNLQSAIDVLHIPEEHIPPDIDAQLCEMEMAEGLLMVDGRSH